MSWLPGVKYKGLEKCARGGGDLPLGGGQRVVQALDGVTHVDDKIRVELPDFLPDPLVDLGASQAGAVARMAKWKSLAGGRPGGRQAGQVLPRPGGQAKPAHERIVPFGG